MKAKISISVILTVAFLIISVSLSVIERKDINEGANKTNITEAKPKAENEEEMRGLWVSYISLDMSGTNRSFDAFKDKFDKIIEKAMEYNCNTLIVQVRPFSDALYESELYPHSHILSGTQGVSTGYDALEYMCKAVHATNLRIHVWINPYRVKLTETPKQLASNNIFVTDPTLCIETESGIYLNPCKQKARELITNGIREIINNYNIDGIQFDDYFYPPDVDKTDYNNYNQYIKTLKSEQAPLSLEDWRKTNVNILIAEVYKTIKDADKNIVFGISPQGNISNNGQIGADVKSWCKYEGYADYICPQMYYSIDNPSLGFEDSLKQWKELNCHMELKVYIGLGVYKAGTDSDEGTWKNNNSILAKELTLLREYGYDGFILYDYNALLSESAQSELKNLQSVI